MIFDGEQWADRWWWLANGATVRRILVDSMAEAYAADGGRTYKPNDWDNVHPSTLPFSAYERSAIAFDLGGTLTARRLALRLADRLNSEVGSEASYITLLTVANTVGFVEYVLDANGLREGVRLYLSPPPNRETDAEFVSWIVSRSRLLWPLDLDILSIHILGSSKSPAKVWTTPVGTAFGRNA